MKVSVSILSSSIKGSDIAKKLDNTNADYLHLDIMDGKFVENKTWTFGEVKKMVSYSTLPLDVHLMVKNPEKYIEDYAMLNTMFLIFHVEAVKDIYRTINLIKNYGLKVGLAINPETNEEIVYPYLKEIDEVLVMGVHPGKSGQSFIPLVVQKISNIREEIEKQNAKTIVSVDGGINDETGLLCKEAGASMLVSASYLHQNLKENFDILKNL